MEEIVEQSDQPPPSVSISGEAEEHHEFLFEYTLLACAFLNKSESDVSVRIVNDDAMTELHQKHSGASSTTDVLTFDRGSDASGVRADIAVCFDVANRESIERGNSVEQELLLYVLHGVLHCCGFDDHEEESFEAMYKEEDRVLEAIGIGPVWSRGS